MLAVAPAVEGARMTVSRALPGTKLESVLETSAETRLTKGTSVTFSVYKPGRISSRSPTLAALARAALIVGNGFGGRPPAGSYR